MSRKVILTFENNEAKEIERALRKKYNCSSSLEALCVRVVLQEVRKYIEMERHGQWPIISALCRRS